MSAGLLSVFIPERNNYYSLYAAGPFIHKSFDKDSGVTELTYDINTVILLYYVYPSWREAVLARNTPAGSDALPGLSKRVKKIFTLSGSRFDKLRRAVKFLNTNTQPGFFERSDDFYIRLYMELIRKGRIAYTRIETIAKEFI
jgi:hypothetical protein